jgi:hypothetical protein
MILLAQVAPRTHSSAGGQEHIMADITTGTGADSMEDIKDEPALASVGVDPETPVAADADGPGQNDEDGDEFDEDDDEESDEDDDEDEDTQQASDTDTE